MKLGEALKKAVETRDARLAGKVADLLRFNQRMNYAAVYKFAHEATGISPEAWEDLMYEADMEG